MSGGGDLENMILSTIERWWGGRYSEKHGLVTSYDPDKHLAKVTFQPSGQESGWLPIETGHIGDGYGIATGPQVGDGKTTGDQVVIRYQGNDIESGKIVQRVHSDDQKPPKVESGETVIWTRFTKSDGGKESAEGAEGGEGQKIYLKKDGTMTMTDGNGATIVWDGKGNIKIDCNNLTFTVKEAITTKSATNQIDTSGTYTVVAGGDAGIGAGGGIEIAAGGILGLDGSMVGAMGGGSVSDLSVNAQTGKLSIPPWVTP